MGHWAPQRDWIYNLQTDWPKPYDGAWVWRDGPPTWYHGVEVLYGYSEEAITDPDQIPSKWKPDPPNEVNIPELELVGGWPPGLTGDLPGTPSLNTAESKDSQLPPPLVSHFRVLPSSIRFAEGAIVDRITTAVEEYESLRTWLADRWGWVFSKPEDDGTHDPPDENAQYVKKWVRMGMLVAADTIASVAGFYVDILNTSAQMYVHSDKESTFPAE